jgi:FAD-dependent sensor of blue light
VHRLVYVSSAVELFSETQLENLLNKCRRNNESAGITGMLLYKDGNFMQCLEGPKEAVWALETRIRLDPRHRGMIVLLTEDGVQPEFREWAMGFRKLEACTALDVPGYSEFLKVPLTAEQFQLKPSHSLKLLLNFKRDMR